MLQLAAYVSERHREELFARVAVVAHRRVVDFEEAESLQVEDPHRLRVELEEVSVVPLGVAADLVGAERAGAEALAP